MRKHDKKNKITEWLLTFVFLYCLTPGLPAQSNLTVDGETYTVNYTGAYKDYILPSSLSSGFIYLTVEGADGGEAYDRSKNGGAGASVAGYVSIGDRDHQVPPGTTIRFIVGQKGRSVNKYGSGGGGTAVAYQKSDDSWVLLMVAGAGGGAGYDYSGSQGNSGNNGTSGRGTAGTDRKNGGSNGGSGTGDLDGGNGGGKNGADASSSSVNGGRGVVDDVPLGGDGGGEDSGTVAKGGFGFGGGGAGTKQEIVFGGHTYAGGGGGGYSGGGAGDFNGNGGGGGSYVNEAYVIASTASTNGTTGSPADGFVTYQYQSNPSAFTMGQVQFESNTAKCFGLTGSTTFYGTNVELVNCSSSNAFLWVHDDSSFRPLSDLSKCLDLTSSNTSNGTNIQLWDCNNTNAQKWIYDVQNQFIRSGVNGNKCIDLVNGNTSSGTNIQLYDCAYGSTKSNMQWTMEEISTTQLDGNPLRIHFTKDPSKCLDFKNASTADGTNVMLYNCHYTDSQYLYFDEEQIKMKTSGKCVDVKSGSTSNGANVQLYHCTGGTAQQWIYDAFTQTFRFKKDINKCLDVSGGQTDNSTNIQLWNCNGTDAQQWRVYK